MKINNSPKHQDKNRWLLAGLILWPLLWAFSCHAQMPPEPPRKIVLDWRIYYGTGYIYNEATIHAGVPRVRTMWHGYNGFDWPCKTITTNGGTCYWLPSDRYPETVVTVREFIGVTTCLTNPTGFQLWTNATISVTNIWL